MRIGVDATCWGNRRGYGRFARSLLGAVLEADRASEYVFFTDETSDEFPLPSSVEVVRVAAGTPTIRAAAANGARSLGDMWAVSRAISRRALDMFFFPSVYSYVPLTSGVAQLVTIHDVIPEKFPELVFPNGWSRLFWNVKVRVACAQARLILTVSEYSRECLREVLGLEPARLRVVNEAGDPAFRRVEGADAAPLWKRLGVPAGTRYIVYVGGFSPHKNLGLLVEVLGELHADAALRDVHLVLAGDYQGDVFFSCYRQLAEQVQKAGLRQRVVFPGYMNDAELLLLLNQAQALALPSFCEGFGLPALEAAACGAPVVATTASPLPGLLGEGAICRAPEDRAGWREALRTVLSDGARRERMRGAALAAAARLSWDHSARQLLEVFAEVATPARKQGVA